MPDVTYENMQANIVSADQEGSMMRCTFKCPVSGTTVESQAAIQQGRGLGDVARRSAKRSVLSRIRWGIVRAVRSAMGGGILGRVAGDVARSATDGTLKKGGTSFSEDEKKAAVLQAFENVVSQFVWDAKNERWMSATAAGGVLTDFVAQLNKAPVNQNYDQGVLARMLTEITMADAQVTAEEKEFVAQFVPAQFGSIDDLAQRTKLSPAEFAETSKGPVRETMLMIAWGLACTDEDLAQAEKQRLAELAEGLEIPEERAFQLMVQAQKFVIDQAMDGVYPDGKLDAAAKQQVLQLAQKIGLDPDSTERVEIRYRKRNGLV
jgi:tellurite resistance protein